MMIQHYSERNIFEKHNTDWLKIIRWQILGLQLTGLWPKRSYGLDLYTLHMIVFSVLLQFVFAALQGVNLFFIIDDFQAVTGTILILVSIAGTCLKTFNLVRNIQKMKHLMAMVSQDIFQTKNEKQKKLILPNIKVWKTTVSAFWFVSCICVFFITFFPILDKTYKNYRLPFFSWYPYDVRKSPQYELTYLYQVMSIGVVALVTNIIDSMIAFLNIYGESQIDILCDDLNNIHDPVHDSLEDVNKKLENCIIHHRMILRFIQDANQWYNWLLLVQFFASGVSIGMALFQLTIVVPFSSEFHYLLTFASATLTQIFMYCWFGNGLQNKSSKLSYALFESDWTGLSPEIKKKIFIFGLALQKSIQISAFGLFYLSLETFVKILRTAWSYFALLRQVNQRK